MVTGFSSGVFVTIILTFIPILLGILALRITRSSSPLSRKDRFSLGIIGLLGLLFWAGLIIGPVIAIIAALVRNTTNANSPIKDFTKNNSSFDSLEFFTL
jgi:hypothetical protein